MLAVSFIAITRGNSFSCCLHSKVSVVTYSGARPSYLRKSSKLVKRLSIWDFSLALLVGAIVCKTLLVGLYVKLLRVFLKSVYIFFDGIFQFMQSIFSKDALKKYV